MATRSAGMTEEIRTGMSRCLWVTAYASYADENPDDEDIARAGGGEDWEDVVPELEAVDGAESPSDLAATDLVKLYETENAVSIDDLFQQAVRAIGDKRKTVEEEELAWSFGWHLAMMALGTGVSWFDDHPKFPLKKPFFECHFDGDELVWSGGVAATKVNPTANQDYLGIPDRKPKDPDDVMHAKSLAEVRQILARIPKAKRCDDACPAWIISDSDKYGTQIERCDECMTSLPKHERLSDEDVRQIPEARAALAKAFQEMEESGDYIDPDPEENQSRWPASSVQSLLFDKDAFTAAAAKTWAKGHGFHYGKVDTTEQYHRLRQFDPTGVPCRTMDWEHGIKAVVCAVGRPPGVPNPDDWVKAKTRSDWPETWERKIGTVWYTVEKTSSGWAVGRSYRHKDPESIVRTVSHPTKEAAMSFAEEDAKTWGEAVR